VYLLIDHRHNQRDFLFIYLFINSLALSLCRRAHGKICNITPTKANTMMIPLVYGTRKGIFLGWMDGWMDGWMEYSSSTHKPNLIGGHDGLRIIVVVVVVDRDAFIRSSCFFFFFFFFFLGGGGQKEDRWKERKKETVI